MHRLYLSFLRGISANWVARIGAGLTTATFILFVVVMVMRVGGGITNPYFDLLLFMGLPPLFVGGLVLVAVGWWLFRREQRLRGLTGEELLRRQFGDEISRPGVFGSKLAWTVLGLTAVNLAVLGGGTWQMREHMDSAEFCGTTCHVMKPEWTAYQDSPHRQVPCVECHVGEGMDALVASKVRGLQQMYEHAAGIYHRPIPTPVHTLSPADETCGRCHAAEHELGRLTKTFTHFGTDAANTRTYDTVDLKVGAGDGTRGVIHWHASPRTQIEFASVSGERQQILWVEVRESGSVVRRYENRALLARADADGAGEPRTMDCTDCHNRVAHVYQSPESRIDELLASGVIDPTLPYIKAKALDAITNDYPTQAVAVARIRDGLERYYALHHPRLSTRKGDEIERAIVALTRLYDRNIHPEMRVEWDSYPSLVGHSSPGQGCFRCHNPALRDEQGRSPSHECTACHSILAQDSSSPFEFQAPGSPDAPSAARHEYLMDEYYGSIGASPPGEAAPGAAAPGEAAPGESAPGEVPPRGEVTASATDAVR